MRAAAFLALFAGCSGSTLPLDPSDAATADALIARDDDASIFDDAARPRLDGGAGPGPEWRALTSTNAPGPRTFPGAQRVGDEVIIWGGSGASNAPVGGGARYDTTTGTWSVITSTDAPRPRGLGCVIAIGSELVVWGGVGITNPVVTNTGARYDVLRDRWRPMSSTGAPAGRAWARCISTGDRMFVHGGIMLSGGALADGALYDPLRDEWTVISSTGAPSARLQPSVVWTGTEVIVWGGSGDVDDLGDGHAYDPRTDTWRPISTVGAPSPRRGHSAVWTGATMLVWGGRGTTPVEGGAEYDPRSDTWTALPDGPLRPDSGFGSLAYVDGWALMLGGTDGNNHAVTDGAWYSVARRTWRPLADALPPGRAGASATTVSGGVIIFGGFEAVLQNTTVVVPGGEIFYTPVE